LIRILSNTKAPYNISTPTATLATSALSAPALASVRSKLTLITSERTKLIWELAKLCSAGLGVGTPLDKSHANFVLIPILTRDGEKPSNARAKVMYLALAEPIDAAKPIVVRFRGMEVGCEGCVRITVGSPEENRCLIVRMTEILNTI
jgi:histidinol-phosphate aminotransferase